MQFGNLKKMYPLPYNTFIPQEPPFLFGDRQRHKRQATNNNPFNYQGFIPEMLGMIKVVLEDAGIDFNYKFELMSEGNYGRKDSTSGQWNGMIQDLIEDVSSIRKGLQFRYLI